MTVDGENTSISDTPNKPRKPWLAAVLSLVAPGLGVMYAGYFALAILNLILAAAVVAATYQIMLHGPSWILSIYLPWIMIFCIVSMNAVWAAWLASRSRGGFTLKPYNRLIVYILYVVIVGVIYALFPVTIAPYRVFICPTSTMTRCLLTGERFLVDLSAYRHTTPARGDVIAFVYPVDNVTRYVKRCVAVAGDTVEMKDKILYVNHQRESTPPTVINIDVDSRGQQRIQPRSGKLGASRDNFGPIVISPGCCFVLGDNRDNSYDSRFWGTVPYGMVLGKASRVLVSPDPSRVGAYIY